MQGEGRIGRRRAGRGVLPRILFYTFNKATENNQHNTIKRQSKIKLNSTNEHVKTKGTQSLQHLPSY